MARDWIQRKCQRKYLICDSFTVVGFESQSVILIVENIEPSFVANLCQRAMARLVVIESKTRLDCHQDTSRYALSPKIFMESNKVNIFNLE